MRIAVIDDEKYSRIVLTHQIRQLLPQAEVAQAASGAQAMELLERQSFDVLFIDIRLGDMEGTTIAALARRLMPRAKIIFATAYSEFAVKAFELRADDYILKPFDPERIRQALERCMEPQPEAAAPQPRHLHRIAVSSNRSTTLLDTEDITYIETDGVGRGCVIHTISGKRYNDSTPLGEYETRLEGEQFYRVHKTSLVHLKYVDGQRLCPAGAGGGHRSAHQPGPGAGAAAETEHLRWNCVHFLYNSRPFLLK